MASPDRPLHQITLVELVVDAAPDAGSVSRMRALLDDALALRPAELIVDLGDRGPVDAAFIGLLLDAHRRIRRTGGVLTLRSVSARAQRNLRLARADRVLPVAPPTASADGP